MKTVRHHHSAVGHALRARRGWQRSARPTKESGSAVIVILILICIMVIFVAANTATLNWLRRQLNVVEQRQTHRLASQSSTNQPLSK